MLVQGETGTGKELVARLLHDFEHCDVTSDQEWILKDSAGKFFDVNCAAFTGTLLQSQLFGHIKGAFSGADRDRKGLFELADSGTVFLDEIGEADERFCAMLLRFLETRRVTRLGEEGLGAEVDVRVVLATDRDLEQQVRERKLSEAFYRRVSALRIDLEPLRHRRDDILMLAVNFWQKAYSQTFGLQPRRPVSVLNGDSYHHAFTQGAMAELLHFDWPGNVRQLRSVVQTAVAIAGAAGACPVTRAHIRQALGLASEEASSRPAARIAQKREQALLEELRTIERATRSAWTRSNGLSFDSQAPSVRPAWVSSPPCWYHRRRHLRLGERCVRNLPLNAASMWTSGRPGRATWKSA